jgi:hypothetical protein
MKFYWYLKNKQVVGHAAVPLPSNYADHDMLKVKELPSMPLLFKWDESRNDLVFFWPEDVYDSEMNINSPADKYINPPFAQGKTFPDITG